MLELNTTLYPAAPYSYQIIHKKTYNTNYSLRLFVLHAR